MAQSNTRQARPLSAGAIIGIVVGAICLAALIIWIVTSIISSVSQDMASSSVDSARRTDMLAVIDAANHYSSNNNAKLPPDGDGAQFMRVYLHDELSDPDGTAYQITFATLASSSESLDHLTRANHTMYVLKGAQCNDAKDAAIPSSSKRDLAVLYYSADSDLTLCVDNQ